MLRRARYAMLALVALGVAAVMTFNYPLGALSATAGFLFFTLLAFWRPDAVFVWLFALLPVIDLAPWTGWISFEEFDILVLASATGAYARLLVERTAPPAPRPSIVLPVLAGLLGASLVVSLLRGVADAGGFSFSWYQGYDGPLNSVRIGKSFLQALWLTPLLIHQLAADEARALRRLALGLALGLGSAALAVLWERLAFTDLLNFSSDYRVTAMFWEMHVGGAALDGWLLLTLPFAFWMLRNARALPQFALALALVLLATYACLVTFSRGVYLGALLSLPLLAWQTRAGPHSAANWGLARWLATLLVLAAMAWLVFPSAGYRGLLAWLGVIAVALALPDVLRTASPGRLAAGVALGILAGLLLAVLSPLVAKGPYLLYALVFLGSLASLHWLRTAPLRQVLCPACLTCLAATASNVAWHWGGLAAFNAMCAALGILAAVLFWATLSRQAPWPNDVRWQGLVLIAALGVSAVTSVFAGGTYMGGRFAAYGEDFAGRLEHWHQSIDMLQTRQDVLFGKGLGRYAANYFFTIPNLQFPGTYRVAPDDGNHVLSLVAPRHPLSFGDVLRVSQRLNLDVRGPFILDAKIRSKMDLTLHAEVCEKHLLYAARCAIASMTFKASPDRWQPIRMTLGNPEFDGTPWYAPRLKTFSVALLNGGGSADVDDLTLSSLSNANLLANGGFENGMQRWFFSSDRDHLPWHAKNLLIAVFVDQGSIGLTLFVLLNLCALWRLNVGHASTLPISPYLSAAIVGFIVVGQFDSLIDVPRLAFAYYLLLLASLTLGRANRAHASAPPPHANRRPSDEPA